MAATPENKVKTWTDKQIVAMYPDRFKFMPVPSRWGGKGIPDILYCIHGRFVAVEVKANARAVPTALQLKRMAEIRAAGGFAICMDGKNEEVLRLIKEFIGDV